MDEDLVEKLPEETEAQSDAVPPAAAASDDAVGELAGYIICVVCTCTSYF